MADQNPNNRRNEVRRRLSQLSTELAALQGELARLGPGESLPGLFLVIEAAGQVAAISSAMVMEIVRLVETTPLPQAPPHVLGTFLYRGEPVVAVDLARFLGLPNREPDVDAHMVVLSTARPVAVVVDRVRALVEAPKLAEAPKDAPAWLSSPLVAALCHAEGKLLPVLRFEALLEDIPT
ncbi:MAG: chemotaxis protein CheW [Deltaproteobacteria bacterium]|nr:chemotaxis protein CheW [Deltaproteobacteria bacterium]